MNNQDRESIEELKTMIENLSSNVDSIHRAIYGDPKNKVTGMIVNQKLMDERIHELESDVKNVNNFRKKFLAYGSIIIAIVGYGINKLIDFMIKHI